MPARLTQKELQRLRAVEPQGDFGGDDFFYSYSSQEDRRPFERLAQKNIFFGYGDAVRIEDHSVIFVGHGGAGKTSLAKGLNNNRSDCVLMSQDDVGLVVRGDELHVFYSVPSPMNISTGASVPTFPVAAIFFVPYEEDSTVQEIVPGSYLPILQQFSSFGRAGSKAERDARDAYVDALKVVFPLQPTFIVPHYQTLDERIAAVSAHLDTLLKNSSPG
ncbi:hypothetical protein MRY87_05175 [bacterium]|nr:hypothetical protein [bacterium]